MNEMKYSGISIRSLAGLYCVINFFFYQSKAHRDRAGDFVILGIERNG